MESFIALLYISPYNFAPRGYALCQGQILNISSNSALFSLLGTTFGGDGRSTFGLPDMQGRVPVGVGQGAGLSQYLLGEQTGSATQTLLPTQIPSHSHALKASSLDAADATPANELLGAASAFNPAYVAPAGNNAVAMNVQSVGISGGGQPFNIVQPYLTFNYIIALEGIFPPRP